MESQPDTLNILNYFSYLKTFFQSKTNVIHMTKNWRVEFSDSKFYLCNGWKMRMDLIYYSSCYMFQKMRRFVHLFFYHKIDFGIVHCVHYIVRLFSQRAVTIHVNIQREIRAYGLLFFKAAMIGIELHIFNRYCAHTFRLFQRIG